MYMRASCSKRLRQVEGGTASYGLHVKARPILTTLLAYTRRGSTM